MRELHVSRIRELTADEVGIKIKDLREELFNLNFRNSMRQLDNPLKIRELRRDLARLMTVLEEDRRGIRSLGMKDTTTEGGATPARKSAKPKAKATAKKKTAAKAKAGSKSKAPGRAAAGKATRARTAGMAKSAGKTKSATRAK